MISVLVRSHNDITHIRATIETLLGQAVDDEVEILCCDDHSADGTAEYLASVKQIRRIPPPTGEYRPGKTLNLLVEQARGELIVFNNADAVPQHRDYLGSLIAPLADRSVDCVFARQIARRDAHAVVRKDYERSFGDGSISRGWDRFFSLVSSGFRAADLREHPFDENYRYSEDVEWVTRRKAKIVYVPEAMVEHSHNYTFRELATRFFYEGVADAQMGRTMPSLPHICGSIAMETLRDWHYLIQSGALREFLYAPVYRFVQKISYYRGARS
mgnify:CR=1 FL=1